ncbi:MAG: mechanosensitive ion channel family protein, partial [Gammaproteobacteria bacterium]
DHDQLGTWKKKLAGFNAPVNACILETEKRKKELEAQLATLGEPVPGESADVRRKREQTRAEINRAEKRLGECRLLALRIQELDTLIDERIQAIVTRRLLSRGPHLFTLLQQNLGEPGIWVKATHDLLTARSGLRAFGHAQWIALLLLAALALGLSRLLRRYLERRGRGLKPEPTDFPAQFLQGVLLTFAVAAPRLLVMGSIAVALRLMLMGVSPRPFVSILADGLAGYFLAAAILRLIFDPPGPARPLLGMREAICRALGRRLRVVALLVLIGYLLWFALHSVSLPAHALLLAQDIFVFFWVVNLVWAASVLIRAPRFKDFRWLFFLVILTLVVSLGAEWLGFRNLALATWRVLLGTVTAYWLAILLSRLSGSIFDSLDRGHYRWSRRLKATLGLEPEQGLPGTVWLRLAAIVLIWGGFLLSVLHVWGVSDAVITDIWSYLFQGFDLGTLHIVPVQLLWAVVVVAVLITVGGWLRTQLDRHWLSHARIDRGAHEALITISGYLITIIAVLVGLSIAGVDFGNLAIIAGALSVGIGFGLQNVVNNFVSGLILLFERPIKTGDWIVVGDSEGYVKQIRIRSTQIQTFDNADVIIPNSDLISSPVTNWMLRELRGRVKIPVTVAYGSDTAQVKEILERLATGHPKVITDGSSPPPKVLFLAFGDSALEFEIRFYIYNIDDRLSVTSDLNFAIDQAFREAGIEIPFPQRDLHIRDWPRDDGGGDGDAAT